MDARRPPRPQREPCGVPAAVARLRLSTPAATQSGRARRKGYVVVACLGYSRAGAGALVFSKQTEDLLFGIGRCLWSFGALPETLVWDRQAGIHAHDGRPTQEFAAVCGQLRLDWHFCQPADPQAKGVVERLQGYLETNFEPGRQFANELDYQLQLDQWFEKANARIHRSLRCRPCDRLAEERELMAPLPATAPDSDQRFVTRVGPDPYLRFDTCDYSLDPRSSAAASRSASRSQRSQRSHSTPATLPAATGAASPSTARSPPSTTPGR